MPDKDDNHNKTYKASNRMEDDEINNRLSDSEFVTMVTRSTSPTPPASSSYVRNRRAEIGIVHQKEVARSRKLPDTMDEETQCERIEETSRFSRYGNNRVSGSPWSTYLDKYSSNATSVGGPSMYSSRGFANASSASGRFNSFAYARTNEAQTNARNESTAKESSNSSQETHSFNNRNQNEKVSSGFKYMTSNENSTSNDANESSSAQNIHATNKEISESRIRDSKQSSCEERKTEMGGNPDSSRIFNQNVAFHRKDNSVENTQESNDSREDWNNRQSSTSRCDECNQRKSSISRVGRSSPKSEVKISKCSSKPEIISPKREGYCERRGSTPKSDASSSSKNEEPLRIVEGHCQNQSEEVISEKRDTSQRKDSTLSGSSQSRSTPQSRNGLTRNMSRQMTRNGSSDGSFVNMPIGRSKSSSTNSMTSQGTKIKTTTLPSSGKSSGGLVPPSVNVRQGGSPDARGKPPVPKNDTTTAVTSKSIVATKYVNKDFRKSTLNMENGDSSRSKCTRRKKSQRTICVNSKNAETTTEYIPQTVSSDSSMKSDHHQSKLLTLSGRSKHTLGRSGSSGSMKWKESRGESKSPCGTKKRPSKMSVSSNSSRSTSANSSSSDDDDEHADRSNSKRRRKRASESPKSLEKRGKISAGSSRTSVLMSSADELSMMTEKPPRPPSSPRSRSDRAAKTEEAKSFLMRALAPVTNFFKNRSQDSGDASKGSWVDSNEENYEICNKSGQSLSASKSISQNLPKEASFNNINSERNDEIKRNHTRIQHQSSDEKPWWLDSNSDNVPEGVEKARWNEDISQDTTISTALPDDGKCKLKFWRQESGERAWWLDDVSAEAETKRSPSSASPVSRRGSNRSSFRSADRRNRIKHQQSGERAWWMSDDPENVPEGIEVIPATFPDSQSVDKPDNFADNGSLGSSKPLKKIRHIESGEKAWWMDSSSNIPDGIVRIPVETNSTSDSSESYEKIDIGVNSEPESRAKRSLSRFPIEFPPPPSEEPLGDRASPEGVENPPDPPDNYNGRDSPYDNVPTTRRLSPRKRPSTLPLFIGQHTDIDDVLGDTNTLCHSPVLSRVRKQERVEEDSFENSSECEEIDATQVIIHDSTPKTPVIQRRNRDNKRIQPDGYIPVSFVV
ncbi:probable serine/threonine-protein kinase DDB_G0282963 [Nylanderia fulva]|uniref:probable serine/threonine-protein kinase DDB_G0282963 n=1 Tax=Nylanderia fulva TaxID=613905 RepID=UPI0010FBB8EC|nr:probable serine/threonine-protein kinase DDB_G0282963 [Nylanderia fulva]